MCFILFKKKGVEFDRDLIDFLKKKSLTNNDGFGYAIKKKGNDYITVKKYVNINKYFNDISKLSIGKDDEVCFHLRLGTSGTKTIDNCHPFSLDGRTIINKKKHKKPVLFHNGVMSYEDEKNPSYCDTRVLTNIMAKQSYNKDIKKIVKTFLEPKKTQKFVVMYPIYSDDAELYGRFVEYNGHFMSNDFGLEKKYQMENKDIYSTEPFSMELREDFVNDERFIKVEKEDKKDGDDVDLKIKELVVKTRNKHLINSYLNYGSFVVSEIDDKEFIELKGVYSNKLLTLDDFIKLAEFKKDAYTKDFELLLKRYVEFDDNLKAELIRDCEVKSITDGTVLHINKVGSLYKSAVEDFLKTIENDLVFK
jgi:hypothetical protein